MMISQEFKDWHLHDAPIENFMINWENRICILELSVFLEIGQDALPCQIIWKNVLEISIPFKAPWGQSIFVNTHSQKDHVYLIEMQSGDEIKIVAESVELIIRSEA